MREIAPFFQNVLLKSRKFTSAMPVRDHDLLYLPFLAKEKICIKQYQQTYSNQDITFIETYRIDALQLMHYNNDASKIKKNDMYHCGIEPNSILSFTGNILQRRYDAYMQNIQRQRAHDFRHVGCAKCAMD